MSKSPELKHNPKEIESKAFKRFFYTFLALFILYFAMVDQVYQLERPSPAPTPFFIDIPSGLSRDDQSLFIAQSLVADISISESDIAPEGGNGALGQVVYDISEVELANFYHQHIDLSEGSHHLAIISYFMLEDYGSQTADIIVGGRYAIRLRDWVFDAVDSVTPTVNATDSHDYDIETISFVLKEEDEGRLVIEKVLIRNHGQLVIYDPSDLKVVPNSLRLSFVMSRGKHSIYPDESFCSLERLGIDNLISVSRDVCDPDQVIEYRLTEEDMVGEPGQTRNPMEGNSQFVLFPEGSDARGDFGRAYSSFIK